MLCGCTRRLAPLVSVKETYWTDFPRRTERLGRSQRERLLKLAYEADWASSGGGSLNPSSTTMVLTKRRSVPRKKQPTDPAEVSVSTGIWVLGGSERHEVPFERLFAPGHGWAPSLLAVTACCPSNRRIEARILHQGLFQIAIGLCIAWISSRPRNFASTSCVSK